MTLTWMDSSSTGFARTDAPLSATLQFSTPLANSISSWPEQQADITRKLKMTQKSLPPFGWDIEPVMGAEVIIEEAFMDVFCDLMYGGGWMEIEREEVDRECNWALVRVTIWVLCDQHLNILCRFRSSSNLFHYPGRLFLAVPTHGLPPQCSFSKSLCRSNTANNYLQAYKTKEHWVRSSHLARK